MMQLGAKHLEENPDFNFRDWRKKIREAREDYEPHVSMHKKKNKIYKINTKTNIKNKS
jgi:hypothetical protein